MLAEPAYSHHLDGSDSRWRVALACIAWAAMHSALAAQPSKALAARLVGPRIRNGCYRFGYVVGSTGMLLAFVRWFARLPDRTLYRVPPPWSWLMYALQALSLGWLGAGVAAVGLGSATGLRQLRLLLVGTWPPSEPEDQGPTFADGDAVPRGPFRFSRHPNNVVAMPFF